MDTVIVSIIVKPGKVEAFRAATLENAAASHEEPGIERFDLLQDRDNPEHFLLYEVFRDAEAPARHKETSHYAKWKELCEPMITEPRTRAYFTLIEP